MDSGTYGAPLFGLLSTFDEERQELQATVRDLETSLRVARRHASDLRKKMERDVVNRRSERERLVLWLERRLKQQEEALQAKYVSPQTKQIIEIEVSLIKRYREMITKSSHTAGSDDPLMPQYG